MSSVYKNSSSDDLFGTASFGGGGNSYAQCALDTITGAAAVGGAFAGAGAAIGTVAPGAGTATGAVIGGTVGALAGAGLGFAASDVCAESFGI